MTTRLGRPALVMLGASLALTTLAGTSAAHATSRSPKPNLVVKAGRLSVPTAPDTGFAVNRRDTTVFAWNQRTKNIGTAPARKSRTALEIRLAPRIWDTPGGAFLRVPGLAPKKSSADNGAFNMHWGDTWEYGTHPTRICADADQVVKNESRESDNCRKTHEIYVVPFSIAGNVTGSSHQDADPGVTLSWTASVSFALQSQFPEPFANHGIIDYHVFDKVLGMKQVVYTISGTERNGCSLNGSGTYQPNPASDDRQFIRLSFGPGTASYFAQILVDPDFSFAATETCLGGLQTLIIDPRTWGGAAWFDTRVPQSFPDPGLTDLTGSSADANATWTWDLSPADS
jgi:hypothetical protein